MDKPSADITPICESLHRLIALHRELLDACGIERHALVQADLKAIQESTQHKQRVVEAIKGAEAERLQRVAELAIAWKRPVRELSLPKLAAALGPGDSAVAEDLRSAFSALSLLVERITEANADNRRLVERSLEHVEEMKRNVLGEAVPKSNTYTAKAQRQAQTSGARLFNKEA